MILYNLHFFFINQEYVLRTKITMKDKTEKLGIRNIF
jgi:hypothetical protein